MRIHLNLPVASSLPSSSTALLNAPSQLTSLTPNGELLLIELQGSLEIENQAKDGHQVLGTITFEEGREDRPVLMVSHHRLEGKFVNLVKPLAVLEKKTRKDQRVLAEQDLNETPTKIGKRSAQVDAEGSTTPRNRTKRAKQGNDLPVSSPTTATPIRRKKDAMDFSSSPPYRSSPPREQDLERTETASNDNDEDDELQDEAQTAVYYDVVNIIKRKILFSKRPEPIVKLGPDLTSAAKTLTSTNSP